MSLERYLTYSEKNKLDKKALLRELALDIAKKYNFEVSEVEKLIKKDTLNSLDSLKMELKNNEVFKNVAEKKVEKLFFTLKWALEVVENTSKLKIKVLKDELENSVNIENFQNNLEEYLPKKLVEKAKNPKVLHEHILWVALGSANTIYKTTEILYKIWVWILKTPYDLYLVASGKGKIQNWDKI